MSYLQIQADTDSYTTRASADTWHCWSRASLRSGPPDDTLHPSNLKERKLMKPLKTGKLNS